MSYRTESGRCLQASKPKKNGFGGLIELWDTNGRKRDLKAGGGTKVNAVRVDSDNNHIFLVSVGCYSLAQ